MHDPGDDGVGLVEIVLAIVILGLAISALLVALTTGVRASATHRELTTQDTVLRSYAEAIKSAVREGCPGVSWTASYPGGVGPPSGYTVSPSNGACPPASGSGAAQEVAVTVAGPSGSKTLRIVVRLS